MSTAKKQVAETTPDSALPGSGRWANEWVPTWWSMKTVSLAHIHSPVPSHASTFSRVLLRLVNRNKWRSSLCVQIIISPLLHLKWIGVWVARCSPCAGERHTRFEKDILDGVAG